MGTAFAPTTLACVACLEVSLAQEVKNWEVARVPWTFHSDVLTHQIHSSILRPRDCHWNILRSSQMATHSFVSSPNCELGR